MYQLIDNYIARLLQESTPDCPLWNIESIKGGKKPHWNYIDACMCTSLLSLYFGAGEQKYLSFVDDFVDYYVSEQGILGYDVQEYNIDHLNGGRVLIDLFKLTHKPKYKKAIELLHSQLSTHPRTPLNSFWHKKIYPNQVWLDGLYMAQVFYTRYETEFNGCKNYSDIVHQFANVQKYMRDEKQGLYYHGFDCTKQAFWADDKGLSRNFWLRSIGWFLVALVDVMHYMEHEQSKQCLAQIFVELCHSLLQYQDADSKMFYQVPNYPQHEGNYLETSGSSMIAYAFMRGANLNILPKSFFDTGKAVFDGICAKYLTQTNGQMNLGGICLVAGLGPQNNTRRDGSLEYYFSEPIVQNDAKGVAPFVMAYTQLLQQKK